jgi:protein-L-isoaspartate(D-aspartate) O-methyltransferase
MSESDDFDRERQAMIRTQIMTRGVRDERVLAAVERVPRHRFVETTMVDQAYHDTPLPIGLGQTISQPFMVAFMAEAAELEPDDRVLEIGTGSGYGAAILGCLADEVWTIERHHELVALAKAHLANGAFEHVHVIEGDGTKGLPDQAPFDAIVVTAAARHVPEALIDQLADGGRLIVPVGRSSRDQMLIRLRRCGERIDWEELGAVRFVPLVADKDS